MPLICPVLTAAPLKPEIQGCKIREMRHLLPDLAAGILNGLLNLSFLPSRCRITEIRLKQIVAHKCGKTQVYLPGFPSPDMIHSCFHIIENTPARHAAQHPEGLSQGVKQHFMGLQGIGPQNEGPAVAEFGVGNLKLDASATNNSSVLTPVKLKGLARLKTQGNEDTASRRLQGQPLLGPPRPDEGRNTAI